MVDVIRISGGHAVMFCSFARFHQWFTEYMNMMGEVDVVDHEKEDGKKKEEMAVFNVESTPLKSVCARGNYNCNSANKRLKNSSLVDVAVHLWRNGLDNTAMLQIVEYNVGIYV